MRSTVRYVVFLLCAATWQTGVAQAQDASTEHPRAEAARIEAALADIEARALRDPELRSMDVELGKELMEAMVRVDPGLTTAAERLPVLQDARARAVRAGDAAAARDAARRIQAIERRYLQAQAEALRQSALAERIERFNTLLRRRMMQMDEDAGHLLRRYAELQPHLNP